MAYREEIEGLDRLGRVMDLVKAHMSAALKADGVALQLMEVHVLRIVLAQEGCTQADVICETRRDKAQIGKLVAMLVSRGLLSKAPDPDDGRRQRLALTPAGEDVARRALAHRAAIAHLLFARISPDEVNSLLALLDQLEASLAGRAPSA